MRRILFAALLAAALTATGCGNADKSDVRATTKRFFAAIDQKDGHAACAMLDPQTRDSVEEQEHKPCEKGVLDLKLQGAPIANVRVFSENAFVTLASGENAFLDRRGSTWYLSAAGCKPSGPGPEKCDAED